MATESSLLQIICRECCGGHLQRCQLQLEHRHAVCRSFPSWSRPSHSQLQRDLCGSICRREHGTRVYCQFRGGSDGREKRAVEYELGEPHEGVCCRSGVGCDGSVCRRNTGERVSWLLSLSLLRCICRSVS